MKTHMTQREKKALILDKEERRYNLRRMLKKEVITKKEFDEKMKML